MRINALLIKQSLSQKERLIQLKSLAISQMESLLVNNNLKKLKGKMTHQASHYIYFLKNKPKQHIAQ